MILLFRFSTFLPPNTVADGACANETSAESGSELDHSFQDAQCRLTILLHLDVEFGLFHSRAG